MTEINTSTKNTGKKYLHKSIRVDLTPMVDLGVLSVSIRASRTIHLILLRKEKRLC